MAADLKSDWPSDAPRVIAHRGASAYAPENTRAAFRRAVELGADALELDVKLAGDGTVIVLHDQTLERTTNGNGDVRRFSYQDLEGLDAGGWLGGEFAGERIPTLEQVCAEFASEVLLNIELTNYASPGDELAKRAVQIVRRMGIERRVLFSSFHPITLGSARRLAPDILSGLLLGMFLPRAGRAIVQACTPHHYIHPQFELLNARTIEGWRRRGKEVITWTVNHPADMRRAMKWGIAGLITDHPDLAVAVRAGEMGDE
jgi:glycerophosphoryl diester phosphodiesterase